MSKVKVSDLQPGMVVDLEGDEFVGEDNGPGSLADYARYELFVVGAVVPETEGCSLVTFDEGHYEIGFPPDHELKVVRNESV